MDMEKLFYGENAVIENLTRLSHEIVNTPKKRPFQKVGECGWPEISHAVSGKYPDFPVHAGNISWFVQFTPFVFWAVFNGASLSCSIVLPGLALFFRVL